jgi:hypothetical protein
MLFYDRSDGRRVRGLPAFNAILPYVMRKRNEASVLFSKDIDVEAAMAYARRKNSEPSVTDEVRRSASGPATAATAAVAAASAAAAGDDATRDRYSLFGVLIAAAVRTIALKPRLNRFVHRRGFYQRKGISVSFIVKKNLTEEAAEGTVKIRFDGQETIDSAMEKIRAGIEAARSGEPRPDDREYGLAHRIPFGKAVLTGAFKALDRFNIAPGRMIDADPLYTSVYIANLGSIGLDTPYHDLYEWGTASIFMVVGRIFQKETRRSGGELRHFVNIKCTVDERIAEGIYYAHAVALFQRLVDKPESLELPPDLDKIEA